MTEHILTTWLLTHAVHGALFAALAAMLAVYLESV